MGRAARTALKERLAGYTPNQIREGLNKLIDEQPEERMTKPKWPVVRRYIERAGVDADWHKKTLEVAQSDQALLREKCAAMEEVLMQALREHWLPHQRGRLLRELLAVQGKLTDKKGGQYFVTEKTGRGPNADGILAFFLKMVIPGMCRSSGYRSNLTPQQRNELLKGFVMEKPKPERTAEDDELDSVFGTHEEQMKAIEGG